MEKRTMEEGWKIGLVLEEGIWGGVVIKYKDREFGKATYLYNHASE